MQPTDRINFPDPVPVVARVFLLLLAMIFGLLIGQLIGVGVAELSGISFETLQDPTWKPETAYERNVFRSITLFGHLFSFLVPALAYGWFLYRRSWPIMMMVHRVPKSKQLVLGAVWIIVAVPLVQYVYVLNQNLPLPNWADQLEGAAGELIQALLVMDSPLEFLFTLTVMAILPALGEEFIFRGLIQQMLEKRNGKPHLAILIAALIFSAWHLQFAGFLPRMLLGLLLGYLFYWSRNLWVPIFVHFVYNGIQVVAAYFSPEMIEKATSGEISTDITPLQLAGSALLTFGVGYYFWRISQKENDLPA
jgi:membrane protease YdiL (CAAX protease family)